jgi:hypothetical protein
MIRIILIGLSAVVVLVGAAAADGDATLTITEDGEDLGTVSDLLMDERGNARAILIDDDAILGQHRDLDPYPIAPEGYSIPC